MSVSAGGIAAVLVVGPLFRVSFLNQLVLLIVVVGATYVLLMCYLFMLYFTVTSSLYVEHKSNSIQITN